MTFFGDDNNCESVFNNGFFYDSCLNLNPYILDEEKEFSGFTTVEEEILDYNDVINNSFVEEDFFEEEVGFTTFTEDVKETKLVEKPEKVSKQNFTFRSTRGKKDMDLCSFEELLKSPFSYLFTILESYNEVSIKLIFADNEVEVVNGMEVKLISNHIFKFKFNVCSFKNKKRKFKFIVSSGDVVIFKSKDFCLLAKKRKVKVSLSGFSVNTKPGYESYVIEKQKKIMYFRKPFLLMDGKKPLGIFSTLFCKKGC